MRRVAIVAGARTPIGKAGGAYKDVHPVELLSVTMRAAVEKTGRDPALIEQIFVGCVQQVNNQSMNIGRNAWLNAGFTERTPAFTLDAQCCSGQEAANLGFSVIASGQADIVLAGGVESLSRVPLGATQGQGVNLPYPDSLLAQWDMPSLQTAVEAAAIKYGVTREAADEYGVRSHLRAAAAWDEGRFDDEITFVERDEAVLLSQDQGIRRDSSVERSAQLSPAYSPDGIVTAANASQFSDGAASLVLASEDACDRYGLEPLAWITDTALVGSDPNFMFEGPLEVTDSILKRAGLTLDDVDRVEIHEAFAVPVLMWLNRYPYGVDKVNVDGAGISLGHPYGATGIRHLVHLAYSMRRESLQVGLQVMCGGGGLGSGTVLRRD